MPFDLGDIAPALDARWTVSRTESIWVVAAVRPPTDYLRVCRAISSEAAWRIVQDHNAAPPESPEEYRQRILRVADVLMDNHRCSEDSWDAYALAAAVVRAAGPPPAADADDIPGPPPPR